jgi:hypothetical protein
MGKPVDFRRSAEASYPERCLVKRGSSANEKGKRKKRTNKRGKESEGKVRKKKTSKPMYLMETL